MDQAFKVAEEYRRKSKALSNISRFVFIAGIVLSVAAVFMPYLAFMFVVIMPIALLVIFLTETPAVIYRFKARKAIRSVITVPDPFMNREQAQDIATLIFLGLLLALFVFIFAFYGSR